MLCLRGCDRVVFGGMAGKVNRNSTSEESWLNGCDRVVVFGEMAGRVVFEGR